MTNRRYSYLPDSPREPRQQNSSEQSRPGLASIFKALRSNQELLRNAGSLAASTGITSGLGFAYWIYAARFFTAAAVGYGSAAISDMSLLSTVGMFGIGTMLVGELPRSRERGELMMAGIISAFAGSLILGTGFTLISLAFGNKFVQINGTLFGAVVFIFGVAINGATLVFDEATIGLLRGGLQLSRNVTVSIAKMAALPVSSLILHDLLGTGIVLSWVLGTLISLIPVAIMIKRSGSAVLHRPNWRMFWQLRKLTLAHNWLNLAIVAPGKLTPVIVALVVPPQSNGAFYIVALLASFLYMVPMHLSTVLFAIASAAPEVIGEKVRFVLRMSLVIGVPGGLVLGVSSHFILSIFGSSYASLATIPLWLQIASYIPGLPSSVYIAVCRATGRLNQAAVFLGAFVVVQMAAIVVGGKIDGLVGLSVGMLAVSVVKGLAATPSVLRAAFGRTRARPAVGAATAGQSRLRAGERTEEIRIRQEAGLATLMALATSVSPRLQPSTDAATVPPAQPALTRPQHVLTRPQHALGRGRHRRPSLTVTAANRAIADTSWWPDVDEATFHSRQNVGMAALIALATHAAQF